MSMFDPSSFLPRGAQFGGNMAAIQKGFELRQEGANYKDQMGGVAGIAGGAMGVMGAVTSAIPQIRQGKQLKAQGQKAAGRVKQAQSGIDMAASAAQMAGPIGAAVAAPLQLISALMNIQGPRQKRQKRQAEQRQRIKAKNSAMRANAAAAGMQFAGGALRTGAHIGPQPTVQDPSAPVHSFNPNTTFNGR
jgi:hypothetical protein